MSGAALIWATLIFKVKDSFNSLVSRPCCCLHATADAMQIVWILWEFEEFAYELGGALTVFSHYAL